MDFKATRAEFNGSIIINRRSNDEIYNFIHYTLNNHSDNYYNCGYYGWNWSIYSLNTTFNKLNYNVYIISSYRNQPTRNYNEIEKYFSKIIKNYKAKAEKLDYYEKQKLNKIYINKITKKLNEIIEKSLSC